MEQWISFAVGPLFRFAFVLMLLGAARLVLLQVWAVVEARRRAGDRTLPAKQILKTTLEWTIPFSRLHRLMPLQSFASFAFHAGVILIPVFFAGHVGLWKKALGVSWYAFSTAVADPLTILALASIGILFGIRLWDRKARFLSGAFDYGVLALLFAVFLTGFFSSHPWLSPIPYNVALLLHFLGAEAVIVMIPFTKLSHAALYATIRFSSETGWKFVPDAGEKVAAALGKEGGV
ncbi:MAG: hypothetical protein AB1742_08230 [bacterium]